MHSINFNWYNVTANRIKSAQSTHRLFQWAQSTLGPLPNGPEGPQSVSNQQKVTSSFLPLAQSTLRLFPVALNYLTRLLSSIDTLGLFATAKTYPQSVSRRMNNPQFVSIWHKETSFLFKQAPCTVSNSKCHRADSTRHTLHSC